MPVGRERDELAIVNQVNFQKCGRFIQMLRKEAHRPVISEEPQSRVESPIYKYPSSRILPQRLIHLLHATEISGFIFKPCWSRITSKRELLAVVADWLVSPAARHVSAYLPPASIP